MKESKKTRTYICPHCKVKSETIIILQKETHYYSINLKTNQWEDFQGDESVELQRFFCINCQKNITKSRIQL